jgi:hypothetical protein
MYPYYIPQPLAVNTPMPHSDLAQIQHAAREYRADLRAWQQELGLRTEAALRRFLARSSRAESQNPHRPEAEGERPMPPCSDHRPLKDVCGRALYPLREN